jgi:hypothetical protein
VSEPEQTRLARVVEGFKLEERAVVGLDPRSDADDTLRMRFVGVVGFAGDRLCSLFTKKALNFANSTHSLALLMEYNVGHGSITR